MNVLIFGATGMVGQGVLRECLLAPSVTRVVTVGRTPTGVKHRKLSEIVHPDLFDYASIESGLAGFDACFFCLGVTSMGLTETEYRRLSYDLTLAAATVLSRLNPGMTFTYVSGSGTDSTERGKTMWARVKGATENALLRLPFKGVYLFRPGVIQAMNGETSKTPAYRRFYPWVKPLLTPLRKLFPNVILTTEQIGRAMLVAASEGAPRPVLEIHDIRALAQRFGR